MDESTLLYAPTHEWAKIDGDKCTIGITRFAVEQLTDVVYVELPAVGKSISLGKPFGVVESVKAVSDLYAPLAGEVVEVNQDAANDPGLLSSDPYDKGWLIKIRLSNANPDVSHLKDKAGYDSQCANQAH